MMEEQKTKKQSPQKADQDLRSSFISVAKLVTQLLKDLVKTYVTENTGKDKKMRKRIDKSIQIINNYQEMSTLLVKRHEFHRS